jgi:antitoxin ParD1/3/4
MPEPDKLSLELPPELNSVVRAAVESGKFKTPDAVVADALKLWTRREADKFEAIEFLRAQVQDGIDSGPGRTIDFEELKAELHAEYERRKDSIRAA